MQLLVIHGSRSSRHHEKVCCKFIDHLVSFEQTLSLRRSPNRNTRRAGLDAPTGQRHISTSLQPVHTVESIAAFDAKTRLSELLDRAARGETFEITKHGRPVGKLGPPDSARDPKAIAEAVARLKQFRGALKGATRADVIALKHDGHRV